MSKQMTPCEKLGYKVGDKFTVIKDSYFEKGTIVALSEDDGSKIPWFTCGGVRRALIIGSNPDVEPTPSKLKPAKQALADAIYQNGGWPERALWAVQDNCIAFFLGGKPEYKSGDRCWYSNSIDGACVGTITRDEKVTNWHQCILSRDEYFTAYPEQVNVEVKNETKHKVEVEMKSESEATINASDWHKNGELPPVGEVCEAYVDYPPQWIETEIVAHKDGFAIGWCKSVMKGCHGDKAHEFRPLRTARDKAIDEMVDCLSSRLANCEEIAAHLYENGYRKEAN